MVNISSSCGTRLCHRLCRQIFLGFITFCLSISLISFGSASINQLAQDGSDSLGLFSFAQEATVSDEASLAAAIADTNVDVIKLSADITISTTYSIGRSLSIKSDPPTKRWSIKRVNATYQIGDSVDTNGWRHFDFASDTALDITLEGIIIDGIDKTKFGGGLCAYYTNLTLKDTTVKYCHSNIGGGILASYSAITLLGDSRVEENWVLRYSDVDGYVYGGGIYAAYSKIYLKGNSKVKKNGATVMTNIANEPRGAMGGGIYLNYGGFVMQDNSGIDYNVADDTAGFSGAGDTKIVFKDNSTVIGNVLSCFEESKAILPIPTEIQHFQMVRMTGTSGVVISEDSTFEMRDNFRMADNYGSTTILMGQSASGLIKGDVKIEHNTGTGIRMQAYNTTTLAGNATIAHNLSIGNATQSGGVCANNEGTLIMRENSSIVGNSSLVGPGWLYTGIEWSPTDYPYRLQDTNGGGVNLQDVTQLYMYDNSSIRDNYSENDGGGVYAEDMDVVELYDFASITGNSAGKDGGGIYHGADNWNTIIADNASVSGNKADKKGGGIYYKNGGSQLFLRDSARIKNNTSGEEGGGIYMENYGQLNYDDTPDNNIIFWGNKANYIKLSDTRPEGAVNFLGTPATVSPNYLFGADKNALVFNNYDINFTQGAMAYTVTFDAGEFGHIRSNDMPPSRDDPAPPDPEPPVYVPTPDDELEDIDTTPSPPDDGPPAQPQSFPLPSLGNLADTELATHTSLFYTVLEGGASPSFPSVGAFSTHEFIGWDKEFKSTVTGDIVYVAQYRALPANTDEPLEKDTTPNKAQPTLESAGSDGQATTTGTGDVNTLIWLLLAIVLATTCIVVISKRKKI